MKLVVQDNILSLDHMYRLQEYFIIQNNGNQYNNWMDKSKVPTWLENITNTAAQHFDLSDCVGYEWWIQTNGSRPTRGWHFDLDEDEWNKNNKLKFPLCSIIYYPMVQDLQGGHFITEDIKVTPKTNRAIFMSPAQLHTVAPYENTRCAVLINPWAYKLEWARETDIY